MSALCGKDLIPKEKIDAIYNENISQVAALEKFGPQTARLLEYHKITANRPAQLFRMKRGASSRSSVMTKGLMAKKNTVKVKGKEDSTNQE